jgi:hypothetical protein
MEKGRQFGKHRAYCVEAGKSCARRLRDQQLAGPTLRGGNRGNCPPGSPHDHHSNQPAVTGNAVHGEISPCETACGQIQSYNGAIKFDHTRACRVSLGHALRTESGARRKIGKIKTYHRFSLFLSCGEHHEATKTQLVVTLARGVSVTSWTRDVNVPRPTVFRCAKTRRNPLGGRVLSPEGLVQTGVRHRCAKHPPGRSGNGRRPPSLNQAGWRAKYETRDLTAFVEIERTQPKCVRWPKLRNRLWQFSLESGLRKRWHLTTWMDWGRGRRAEDGGRRAEKGLRALVGFAHQRGRIYLSRRRPRTETKMQKDIKKGSVPLASFRPAPPMV